jgi:CheY-like chemotaxis protein
MGIWSPETRHPGAAKRRDWRSADAVADVTVSLSGGTPMSSSGADVLTLRRILVVEDEYFLADDMARALREQGAEVIGPVPTAEKALAVVALDEKLDAAVLDINLRGAAAFAVADALKARGIPFVFATGYASAHVPTEHRDVPRWEKPFDPHDLAKGLPGILHACA